ncbi:hypothetical protein ON010_g5642 [Phytophthora cinnamomi]|nr:hypothetical protein ON010_g5642 [Phytophthora cinnamomi]
MLRTEYYLRKTVAVSQSVSSLVTCFMAELDLCLQERNDKVLDQMARVGFLIGWESLISSHGKELYMISDAWVAIKCLESFSFKLCERTDMEVVVEKNEDTGYIIKVPVPPAQFAILPESLQLGGLITVTSVLFTQGINEMQSLANMVGHSGVSIQRKINSTSFHTISEYYNRFTEVCGIGMSEVSVGSHPDEILRNLRVSVESENSASKNTCILLHAADAVRSLNGGRVTYCKSGKDRTAMSTTLEQARLLVQRKRHVLQEIESGGATEYGPLEEVKDVANTMRAFGVRIHIAKKNVGRFKYSFNSLQRKLLPEIYRPPMSTIQDMVTGTPDSAEKNCAKKRPELKCYRNLHAAGHVAVHVVLVLEEARLLDDVEAVQGHEALLDQALGEVVLVEEHLQRVQRVHLLRGRPADDLVGDRTELQQLDALLDGLHLLRSRDVGVLAEHGREDERLAHRGRVRVDVHLLAVARASADGEVVGRVAIKQNLPLDLAAGLASRDDIHERGLASARGPHERGHRSGQGESRHTLEQVDLQRHGDGDAAAGGLNRDADGGDAAHDIVRVVDLDGVLVLLRGRRHLVVHHLVTCSLLVLLDNGDVLGALVALVLQHEVRGEDEHEVARDEVDPAVPDPRGFRLQVEDAEAVLAHGQLVLLAVVDASVDADVELGRQVLVDAQRPDAPRERVDPVDPYQVVGDAALRDKEAAEQHEEQHGHHHERLGNGQVGRRGRQEEEEAREPHLAQEQCGQEHDEAAHVVHVAAEPVRDRAEDDRLQDAQRDLRDGRGQHVRARAEEVGAALLVEDRARLDVRRHLRCLAHGQEHGAGEQQTQDELAVGVVHLPERRAVQQTHDDDHHGAAHEVRGVAQRERHLASEQRRQVLGERLAERLHVSEDHRVLHRRVKELERGLENARVLEPGGELVRLVRHAVGCSDDVRVLLVRAQVQQEVGHVLARRAVEAHVLEVGHGVLALAVEHDAAFVHQQHVVEQLEHLRGRLQQRDHHGGVEVARRALHGLANVVGGSTIKTRADLVEQLQTLHAEHHLARRDALALAAGHASQHCVAHHCVLAVVQAELLHRQVRRELVVRVHHLDRVLVVLGRAVLDGLQGPGLHARAGAAAVRELERLLGPSGEGSGRRSGWRTPRSAAARPAARCGPCR